MENVHIEKLVHGGQGLGTLADGRKVFVWNALPGEMVTVEVTRHKKNWAEGIAREVITPSPQRIAPKEASYLATSPWQILGLADENFYKAEIVRELFAGEHLELPEFEVKSDGIEWGYRNKMEYSFYADDDGLHLALFNRGSHQKLILEGSALARPELDAGARAVVAELNRLKVRGSDLKTVIVRSSAVGTAAALYVKQPKFPSLKLPSELTGLKVYFSNPKSPASVPTKLLYELGDTQLRDTFLGTEFRYTVDSFFQVNPSVFEQALTVIEAQTKDATSVVDMYGGVGTIGLSLNAPSVVIVEVDPANTAMARTNGQLSGKHAKVVEASSEKVVEHITSKSVIIFDPPRAGLHTKVIQAITEVQPAKIIYLSCNPATHARDIGLLKDIYRITDFSVYNFFPHTPHIESLAVLELK